MDRWSGKVAIVTGASAGIGATLCAKLVSKGLKVVGLARREGRIQELSNKLINEPGKLYAVKADLTKEEDILNAFKWTTANVGPVSILINNAGILGTTTIIDGDAQQWKSVFDTNVMALLMATREAIKIMEQHKIAGHIVMINSILGLRDSFFPQINVYGASKHAVRNITEVLKGELNERQSKIKVSSIYPGLVRTEFTEQHSDDLHQLAASLPALTADEVVDTVVFALSAPPNVNIADITIMALGEKH